MAVLYLLAGGDAGRVRIAERAGRSARPALRDVVVARPAPAAGGDQSRAALGRGRASLRRQRQSVLAAAPRLGPDAGAARPTRRISAWPSSASRSPTSARARRARPPSSRAPSAGGREALARKIARWRPRVVALVGVTLYDLTSARPRPRARAPSRKPSPGRASSWCRTPAASTPASPDSPTSWSGSSGCGPSCSWERKRLTGGR